MRPRARLSRREALVLLTGAVLACRPTSTPQDSLARLYAIPARDEWPDVFRELAPEIQDAYRYAVAHRDILRYMPCFCGCVEVGHASNYDCYVRETYADGRVLLDTMSFG